MYKLLLCLRYLRTRYIALASVISVMLGVATMIVVNSVMSGFGIEMKDRIRGILSDVVVESTNYNGVEDPDRIREQIMKVAGKHIEAITPTVETHGMMSFRYSGQTETRPIVIVGIDPEGKSLVSPMKESLQNYKSLYNSGTETEENKIRGPLLFKDVPLSWNLTPEALAYRKRQTEYENWDTANKNLEQQDAPEFTEEAETDETASNTESPFDVFEKENNSGQPEIGALHTGRAYVGKGLLTFPHIDRQGQLRTMRLGEPGMDVSLMFPSNSLPPKSLSMPVTVVDFFECGMSEYDDSIVFVNIEELQRFKGMRFTNEDGTETEMISSFQIKLKNYDESSAEVVEAIRASLASTHMGRFHVSTWENKQSNLLAAVEMEKAILNVLLSLIIAVAGFGILAIFFMIVVEKTRDIGILKSLGASSRGVMTIFLSYGLGLGVVGSGVGIVLGLTFVAYINEIEEALSRITGQKVFDDNIYYFQSIPTSTSTSMVLWVAFGATLMAVMASVFPARRAAKLNPVEALRHQ